LPSQPPPLTPAACTVEPVVAAPVLTREDKHARALAIYAALEHSPVGMSTIWYNPPTGHFGVLQVLKAYESPRGRWCKDLRVSSVVTSDEEHLDLLTACRAIAGWMLQ